MSPYLDHDLLDTKVHLADPVSHEPIGFTLSSFIVQVALRTRRPWRSF